MYDNSLSTASRAITATPDTVDQIYRTLQHVNLSLNTIILLIVCIAGFTVAGVFVYLLYKVYDKFSNV